MSKIIVRMAREKQNNYGNIAEDTYSRSGFGLLGMLIATALIGFMLWLFVSRNPHAYSPVRDASGKGYQQSLERAKKIAAEMNERAQKENARMKDLGM